MRNWKNIAFFVVILAALAKAGHAVAERSNAKAENDFPARVLNMAKSMTDNLKRDLTLLAKTNKNTISRDYGPAMARIFMARDNSTSVPYLMDIVPTEHYCFISLKPGSVCGIQKLPIPNEGVLFISHWIHAGGERYFLMIIGSTGPERTIIARVTYKEGIKVLYDTFANKQECPLPSLPSVQVVPGVSHIATVIRIKTLSPTSFELYEKSYSGIVRTAKLKLSLGPSSCRLQAKTETFYVPPTATRPGVIEKAGGG